MMGSQPMGLDVVRAGADGPVLRVLHVISGDLWAGAEAQAAALLVRLAREPGVEVHAALMNHGELERRLLDGGIAVTVFDEARLGPVQILRGLRHLVRTFDPHVVHTHRFKENILGGLAARLERRRPSVRTVHGAPEFAIPWWRIDKQALRRADEFVARHWQQCSVAVSRDLMDLLRSSMPGLRVELIYNGLDHDAFAAQRSAAAAGRETGRRCVSFVGRLVPVKRVDLFLGMASRLLGDDPSGWHFQVVGDGPLRAELESLAAGLGLGGQVEFLGFRADANELVAHSDVLVFTSDHEGTPMAALEALAMAVPVVARAVGGLVEMLEGVESCVLVNGDDPASIAAAVSQSVGDPGHRDVRLPRRYQIDNSAQAYLALYRELGGDPSLNPRAC